MKFNSNKVSSLIQLTIRTTFFLGLLLTLTAMGFGVQRANFLSHSDKGNAAQDATKTTSPNRNT
ncbi:MAG: hypothetical protein ACOYOT_11035 [Bacteroidales bacterium]